MIEINGITYSDVSDEDGHVSVPIKSMDVGKYVVQIMSQETSRYAAASATLNEPLALALEYSSDPA